MRSLYLDHVPKCGGTTLTWSLVPVVIPWQQMAVFGYELPVRDYESVRPRHLSGKKFVSGHGGLRSRYVREWILRHDSKLFGLFRSPAEVRASIDRYISTLERHPGSTAQRWGAQLWSYYVAAINDALSSDNYQPLYFDSGTEYASAVIRLFGELGWPIPVGPARNASLPVRKDLAPSVISDNELKTAERHFLELLERFEPRSQEHPMAKSWNALAQDFPPESSGYLVARPANYELLESLELGVGERLEISLERYLKFLAHDIQLAVFFTTSKGCSADSEGVTVNYLPGPRSRLLCFPRSPRKDLWGSPTSPNLTFADGIRDVGISAAFGGKLIANSSSSGSLEVSVIRWQARANNPN